MREFAVKLRDALKADPAVPYLVWRAYETWIVLWRFESPAAAQSAFDTWKRGWLAG